LAGSRCCRAASRARSSRGLPLPGLDIEIFDENWNPLPHDGKAVGELCIRGPWIASEYYNNPQPDKFHEGWLVTGDVAKIDSEQYLIIADRSKAFNPAKADARHGLEVFTQTCAACHAIDGKGGNIGPQLDGIGGRGATRLLEDILDPGRNVDKAFRLTMATKKDGAVVTGMLRREEAGQIILVDLAGQETRLQQSEVSARKETETSLMPPNFAELLSEPQLNDLLAFLLSKAATK
jgi:putative heme-binding domain-containing protein